MKKIIGFFILFIPIISLAMSKESFIQSWENYQKNSKYVEKFEKIAEHKYAIKFSKIPYDGELTFIAFDTEELTPMHDEDPVKISGYAMVELSNFSEELTQKYGRLYYKWTELNSLFFDSSQNQWISNAEYSELIRDYPLEEESSGFLLIVMEYWYYVLIIIILYFFISSIFNNRKIDKSLKLQQDALDITLNLHKESVEIQKKAIEESKKLHQETNQLLKALINKTN